MSGFGYRIVGGKAERVEIQAALAEDAELVWVHLSTSDDRAQAWLRDEAGLQEYVVEALTAVETRPRCEGFDDGALINLRGRAEASAGALDDLLASVRIWAVAGRVFSITRKPMIAVAEVEQCVEAGDVRDPGDLIAEFAAAITEDLDPHVADLGDRLDDCEESLDTTRAFELRRGVARGAGRIDRLQAFPGAPSAPRLKSWRRCHAPGCRTTTGSISTPLPIARRGWPRNSNRSANAPR